MKVGISLLPCGKTGQRCYSVSGQRVKKAGCMRFDVHKVRTYLVNALLEAHTVARVSDDGADVVIAELLNGQTAIIHLIERLLPVNDIVATLDENTAARRHTLFVLWGDMLLPEDQTLYLPDDWMEVLLTLYGGKIYGYDSYGPYASVFPAYFEAQAGTMLRFVRYGASINAAGLRCDRVQVNNRFASGQWLVADFGAGRRAQQADARAGAAPPQHEIFSSRSSLSVCYTLLAVPPDADAQAVRRAYRRLARQYHPDLNAAPEATLRMQQINEAYRRIMRALDADQ